GYPRARVCIDPEECEVPCSRDCGAARSWRVLLLGEGEAGGERGRASGPDRIQAALLRRDQHRLRTGPTWVCGDRDRYVLLGRAPPAAGRRSGRLARAA